MTRAEKFCRRIDAVNKWAGLMACMLLLPLVGIVMMEVILRHFFKSPTIWAWDVNVQLAAVIAIAAGGYGLLNGSHVSVDVISSHLARKTRAWLDLATSVIFFFVMGSLTWVAISRAAYSIETRELYTSLFEPPLYPLRIVAAVSLFLMLIQGIAKFIRDLAVATSANETNVA